MQDKKRRIYASLMNITELEIWEEQMYADGFTKLWTWICWVIRQHIKEKQQNE